MPMAVVAAGGLAGSYAASKVMGKGNQAPSGGGIPGLTSSKGAGKSGKGAGYAIQVDPTAAIDYFNQATNTQAAGYDQGIQYYKTAIDQAKKEVINGFSQANNTLQPMSYAAGQALNQQLRMLGMDPMPATNGMGQALIQTYGQSGISNESVKNVVAGLAQQMDAAGKIKDPGQRAAALAQIQQTSGSGLQDTLNGLQAQLAAIKDPVMGTKYTADQLASQLKTGTGYFAPQSNMANNPGIPANGLVGSGNGVDVGSMASLVHQAQLQNQDVQTQYENAQAAVAAQRKGITDQISQLNGFQNTLKEAGDTFAQNYGSTYDAGYGPDQIANVVTNLPGYQFQLAQGTEAIDRSAAAKGMLNSGNTGLALQNYGQGQAQSYYNQYMNYLAGVQQEGAPATMQISSNQSQQGIDLANLAQSYGSAQMQSEQAKANFAGQMLANAGMVYNQDSLYNAQAQNASILQANALAAGQSNQAMASGVNYANSQNQLGYLQAQGQASGQGMLSQVSQGTQHTPGMAGYTPAPPGMFL